MRIHNKNNAANKKIRLFQKYARQYKANCPPQKHLDNG